MTKTLEVAACVLREVSGPLTVEPVVLPAPGPGRVRVRISAAGICHSDLSLARGVLRQGVPAVLGHEGSGVVESVGAGVSRVAVGDRVVLCWAPPCRECPSCQRQEPWLCQRSSDATAQPYATLADGTPVLPGLSTAAFAEATVVSERACVQVPDGVDLEMAALVGCAVATGVGAVRNTARLTPGESALVVGLGGVGLSAVQGARLAGAGTVIAVDPAPDKRDLAMRLGATHALAPSDTLAKEVRSLTGEGVDAAFDCVGRGTSMRSAWSATRRGGRLVLVGIGGSEEKLTLSSLEMFAFARRIEVSVYGSTDPDVDFPWLLERVAAGELDLAALVDGRVTLTDVSAAFDDMAAGSGLRRLVVP